MTRTDAAPWEPTFTLDEWTPELRSQHFNQWHDALASTWNKADDPAIIVSAQHRNGAFGAVGYAPAGDFEALWEIVEDATATANGTQTDAVPTVVHRVIQFISSIIWRRCSLREGNICTG